MDDEKYIQKQRDFAYNNGLQEGFRRGLKRAIWIFENCSFESKSFFCLGVLKDLLAKNLEKHPDKETE